MGSTYAQAGLKIFQSDNNWIKVAHNRNADGNPTGSAQTYFELANESNGTRTLGTRTGLAGTQPADVVDAGRPHRRHDHGRPTRSPIPTARARTGSRSARANIDTVMPAAAGPRYIGVYGGNGSINVLAATTSGSRRTRPNDPRRR